MGRGFSLRDINKMTEEEAGIYFDKVPGFENLKKQLDEEKSDKPFFLNLPGFEDPRTPTEKQAVVNPYTGETKYDKKPETLEEYENRQKELKEKFGPLAIDYGTPLAPEKLTWNFKKSKGDDLNILDYVAASDEAALTAISTAFLTSTFSNMALHNPTEYDELSKKYDGETNPLKLAMQAGLEGEVPFVDPNSVQAMEELLKGNRTKDSAIRVLSTSNENRGLLGALATGIINPINYVPIGGGAKLVLGTGKIGKSLVTGSTALADNVDVLNSIVKHVPDSISQQRQSLPDIEYIKEGFVSEVFNKKLDIMGDADLYENDLRMWLNMPDDGVTDLGKYFTYMNDNTPHAAIQMARVDEMMVRLIDLGLVEQVSGNVYKKRIRSGTAAHLNILQGYANSLGKTSTSGSMIMGLRTLNEIVGEIVNIENPYIQGIVKKLGINPSVGATTPVEKAIIAYLRQSISIDELIEVALQAGLDSRSLFGKKFGIKGSLRLGEMPISIDKDGIVEGTGTAWNDVFSDPQAFKDVLSDEALEYIQEFRKMVDDIEALRVAEGLTPLTKDRGGLLYIPRKVDSIDAVKILGRTDSHQSRTYDLATEGMFGYLDETTGEFVGQVNYLASPRETLKLHLKAAYHEILDEQLTTYLTDNNIGVTLDEAFQTAFPKIAKRYDDTKKAKSAAQKKLKTLSSQLGEEPSKRDPRRFAERSELDWNERTIESYKKLVKDIDEARAEYGKAKAAFNEQRLLRARKMSKLRWDETASGKIFGGTAENISVKRWRNRLYKKEDFDTIQSGIKSSYGDPTNFVAGATGRISNTIRFLSSFLDFGAPFIQGLPTLARNPIVWSQATKAHFAAWFDPAVQARFMRENLETYQEMAKYGVPVGDVEVFSAVKRGGGLNPAELLDMLPKDAGDSKFLQDTLLGKATVKTGKAAEAARGSEVAGVLGVPGKQTVGRFQSSYSTFLGMSRALLWKNMKDDWVKSERKGNSLSELAAHIRNMTGALDSKALGVSSNLRAVEGTWLAFSPRLLRSTFALVSDAVSFLPTEILGRTTKNRAIASVRQKEAFRSLATLLTGVHGIYMATEWYVGLARGNSFEQISYDIRRGLNPLSGSKYLSVEINGQNYGVGGQVRALTQVMTAVASSFAPGGKDFEDLYSTDLYENPIFQWLSYRGAVGPRIAQAVLEAASQRDAAPFDKIEGPIDVALHLGTGALPFAIQGKLEGDNMPGSLFGFLGGRSSPESPNSEIRKIQENLWFRTSVEKLAELGHVNPDNPEARPKIPTSKNNLSLLFQNYAKERHPEILDLEEKAMEQGLDQGNVYSEYKAERFQLRQTKNENIQSSYDANGTGKILREIIAAQNEEYYSNLDGLQTFNPKYKNMFDDFDNMDPSENAFNLAIDEYFRVMSEPGLEDPVTGEFDFDEREKRIKALQNSEIVGPQYENIRKYIRVNKTPIEQELDDNRETLKEYWGITDDVVEEENFKEKFDFYQSQSDGTRTDMERGEVENLNWTRKDRRKLRGIQAEIEKRKKTLRKDNFVIDALLYKWGYMDKSLNKDVRRAIRSMKSEQGGTVLRRQDIQLYIEEFLIQDLNFR